MSPISLLAGYTAAIQQHQAQFTPDLENLRTLTAALLKELDQQESVLLTTQTQQLALLQADLANNARCLLQSMELLAYLNDVQSIMGSALDVHPAPAAWQLAQTDWAIALLNYCPTINSAIDPGDRANSVSGYMVTLRVNDQEQLIAVTTHRIDATNEQHYDLHHRLKTDIQPKVKALLNTLQVAEPLQTQLIREVSYLVGCGAHLLALAAESAPIPAPNLEENG